MSAPSPTPSWVQGAVGRQHLRSCPGCSLQLEALVLLPEGPALPQRSPQPAKFGVFPRWGRGGRCLEGGSCAGSLGLGEQAGAFAGSRLLDARLVRRNCKREMWWNLFSSNPCWVCHNNRFYFCGICRPLMGWVFTLPEMVPVSQQRFLRFFLGRLRRAPEPCQSGQQLRAKIILGAAAPVSPGPGDGSARREPPFLQQLPGSPRASSPRD